MYDKFRDNFAAVTIKPLYTFLECYILSFSRNIIIWQLSNTDYETFIGRPTICLKCFEYIAYYTIWVS